MHRAVVVTVSTAAGVAALLAAKPHHAVLATPPGTAAPGAAPAPGAHAAPAPSALAGSRDGTYTGDTIETKYGPVQVEVTIAGGRMTDVRVLQTPSDSGKDRAIAARSVPRLTQEALAAQSARIHAVSGASYTSEGYTRSLQSALDQARA